MQLKNNTFFTIGSERIRRTVADILVEPGLACAAALTGLAVADVWTVDHIDAGEGLIQEHQRMVIDRHRLNAADEQMCGECVPLHVLQVWNASDEQI